MKKSLLCSVALVAAMALDAQNVEVATGKYSPEWESLNQWECPEWFKDAKFGIWAHWGPQCEAETGDWYARHMYYDNHWQGKHHVKTYGSQSEYGLKELCRDWKAENWNPDALVKFYKSVGARYFFTLGNHHDNFDLWDSPYQEWNSVNVGPKKDIVRGWADACEKYGLPLGISMHASHTWTWMEGAQKYDGNLTKEDGYKLNPDGTEKWWKGLDPQELYAQRHEHSEGWEREGNIHSQWNWGKGASLPSEEYKMKFQNRVLECINTFSPDMVYFDDTVLPFYGCDDAVGQNILSHYYNTSAKQNGGEQQVVVMGKVLEERHKDFMLWDVERGTPDRMQEKYWQTCTCLGSWHYERSVYERNGYKSAGQVISMLVDVVSKNGNMLLSVPIRADGTIDDKEIAILNDIKAWMDVNSVSIYGTRPWKTFGEGPLAEAVIPINAQGFNESNNYSADDIRFVQRNDTVFATTLRYPSAKSVTIEALGLASKHYSGKVKSVTLLGHGDVSIANGVDGLNITMPEEPVNKIAAVFVITFDKTEGESVNLKDIKAAYEAKIKEMRPLVGNNTGKISKDKFDAFVALVKESKSDADVKALHDAYQDIKENGTVKAGLPMSAAAEDCTRALLVEVDNFSRKDKAVTTRFASPKHWTVENFSIPNGADGVKNGLDKYTGKESLMLGVWNDRERNNEGDLSNARIYRKVTLKPGTYYFGAKFNTITRMPEQAYVFASASLCPTSDIPAESMAFAPIGRATADGGFYGITFTVKKKQEVVLGFQVDLTAGSPTQEFRADEVKLLNFLHEAP